MKRSNRAEQRNNRVHRSSTVIWTVVERGEEWVVHELSAWVGQNTWAGALTQSGPLCTSGCANGSCQRDRWGQRFERARRRVASTSRMGPMVTGRPLQQRPRLRVQACCVVRVTKCCLRGLKKQLNTCCLSHRQRLRPSARVAPQSTAYAHEEREKQALLDVHDHEGCRCTWDHFAFNSFFAKFYQRVLIIVWWRPRGGAAFTQASQRWYLKSTFHVVRDHVRGGFRARGPLNSFSVTFGWFAVRAVELARPPTRCVLC
jgi:hypothetical protein